MTTAPQDSQFIAINFGVNHVNVAVGSPTNIPSSSIEVPIDYSVGATKSLAKIEFDPAQTLELIKTATRKVIADADVLGTDIVGIGVSSQSRGIVLLDFDGNPLIGIPFSDRRTDNSSLGSSLVDIWELTGQSPESGTGWARLHWVKDNDPETYEKTRTICSVADWLVLELTGELLMEQTHAADAGMGLITSGEPATAIGNSLNLTDVELPLTSKPGTEIGKVRKVIADELGLSTKTSVVACGPSLQSALVGLGMQMPHTVGIFSGSRTECIRVTDSPVFDDTRSLNTSRHVIENRWLLKGNSGDTGTTYQWLISLLYGSLDNVEVMESIDEPLAQLKPGATGISAFLGPSLIHAENHKERTGGLIFPIPATSSSPDRFDFARAALESFAFAIRYNIERLNSFRGPARAISAGGGMFRTQIFRQILADVLNHEIGIDQSGNPTLLGALDQTSAAIGNGPTIAEYCAIRSSKLETYEPNSVHAGIYETLYSEWRHSERMLENIET